MKPLSKRKGLTLMEGLTAVVVVGLIGLFMGFFALFNDKFTDTNRVSVSVTNESIIPTTIGDALAGTGDCDPTGYTISNVVNGSALTQIISSGNYSISSIGIVTNLSDTVGDDYWLANYSYTRGGAACNVTTSMNTEFQNQTDILGLVLLAVFFGIAITALLASFLVRLMNQNRL